MKLSVVVPAFNESATIAEVICQVDAVEIDKEIIVVDDGSTDGTPELLEALAEGRDDLVLVRMDRNRGKGAALREGFRGATGDVIVIQYADLEYDPADFPALLALIETGETDVVYGSRTRGDNPRSYWRYYLGGRLVTIATNLLYGCHITDEPTCYKMFRASVLDDFELVSTGFEFCPEFTARVLLSGRTIAEVPIHYAPRSIEEGKKIRWTDGVIALWTLLKLRVGG